MDRGKRRTIRSKMRTVVLMISMISLIFLSLEAAASMLFMRSMSKKALISQMEQNLKNTVRSRADLVDAWLQRYAGEVTYFADYIHNLYSNPDMVKEAVVLPASAENKGKLVMQAARISEDIPEENVAAETALLGNLEMIFYPILTENEDVITSAYFATERGLTMAYDKQSDMKVDFPFFNALETNWYKLAKEEGTTVFTDVYLDSFGRGLTITCVSPFFEADGAFAGVVGMDILISDMYRNALAMDLDEGAYVMLVDNQGNVISPNMAGQTLSEEEGIDDIVSERILSGYSGISLSKDNAYFAYAKVKCTDWKYCVRMPEEVILSSVKDMDQMMTRVFMIFAAVFLFVVLGILIFARKFAESVTRPIIALGNDAMEISGGNLEHRAVVQTNDEIGDLAISFNTMASELRDYIDNLTRVTAEKERISAELNVANHIQADMLPRIYPAFPTLLEFDIYATMHPAKEVGGDFYDFFLIDNDKLGIVMADVSGKGVPAALFMVIAKTLIKNRAQMGGTPSEILSFVNDQLCDGNEAELFVTVWFAIMNIHTGEGIAVNAGHEHPVLRRCDGTYELVIYRHSPALAVMEGIHFRQHEFKLNPGDSIFVYTDGVPEATNAKDELFGANRMLDALNREPDADLHRLLDNVRQDIRLFVNGAPQFDDITMLGLVYYGEQEHGIPD